jgi:hypothetical protein
MWKGGTIFGLQIRKQQEKRLGGLSKNQMGGPRAMADSLIRSVDFNLEEAIRMLRAESRLWAIQNRFVNRDILHRSYILYSLGGVGCVFLRPATPALG